MIAFQHIANYIPVRKELKLRIEGNIGIVCDDSDFKVEYLNETALAVFRMINGKRTVEDIVRCFTETVDVSRDVFESDVVELLRNFQWQKLIALKQPR
jgi:hypothetical protein